MLYKSMVYVQTWMALCRFCSSHFVFKSAPPHWFSTLRLVNLQVGGLPSDLAISAMFGMTVLIPLPFPSTLAMRRGILYLELIKCSQSIKYYFWPSITDHKRIMFCWKNYVAFLVLNQLQNDFLGQIFLVVNDHLVTLIGI